jgi:hypothetical protein
MKRRIEQGVFHALTRQALRYGAVHEQHNQKFRLS